MGPLKQNKETEFNAILYCIRFVKTLKIRMFSIKEMKNKKKNDTALIGHQGGSQKLKGNNPKYERVWCFKDDWKWAQDLHAILYDHSHGLCMSLRSEKKTADIRNFQPTPHTKFFNIMWWLLMF